MGAAAVVLLTRRWRRLGRHPEGGRERGGSLCVLSLREQRKGRGARMPRGLAQRLVDDGWSLIRARVLDGGGAGGCAAAFALRSPWRRRESEREPINRSRALGTARPSL